MQTTFTFRDKELLSARVRNEGEFWMAFDDFARQFSHLDLVISRPMLDLNLFYVALCV